MKVFPSLILSFTLIFLWSCSDFGPQEIEGCMDNLACNYNSEATVDDDNCLENDCDDICGGSAVVDECGVCGGGGVDATTACCLNTGAGLNGEAADCAGVCGGDAVDDACGTCEGSITDATQCDCPVSGEIRDCAGDCGGTAVLSGCDNVCNSTKVNDCAGDCGGSAVDDECGECGGDNSSCVNYSTEIQHIFTANCIGCHGSSGGLNLGSYSTLMSGGSSGTIVISGNGSGSRLIQKLQGTASGSQMPKGLSPLDETTINLIKTWIDEGALDN